MKKVNEHRRERVEVTWHWWPAKSPEKVYAQKKKKHAERELDVYGSWGTVLIEEPSKSLKDVTRKVIKRSQKGGKDSIASK